jgi:hypothetical protein
VPAAPVHTALGGQHWGTGLRHPLCRAVIVMSELEAFAPADRWRSDNHRRLSGPLDERG